jgi:hypothetical protein
MSLVVQVKHNKDFNNYSNPLVLAYPVFYLFDIKSLIDKDPKIIQKKNLSFLDG